MFRTIDARRLLGICTILAAVGAATPAGGQKATERYIPLGQSPGVSQKLTVIGRISAVDPQRRTITVAGPSGAGAVEVKGDTRIWIDRSKAGQTNINGSFADLRAGRTVEVKFVDPVRKRTAEWIKVEAPAGP